MLGKNLEITPMEALFLMVLYNTPSLSGSEIVQNLRSNLGEDWSPSPGATYKTVQSLEKKGLIQETTQKANRKDQRIRTYSLTAKGKVMVPEVTSRVRKIVIFTNECCPEYCEGISFGETNDSNSDC
ncbi:MAG: PadR family transcriptional regulator [Candidatus Hermodarchaeota archaeon]